jgi:ribosomal protein S27AE
MPQEPPVADQPLRWECPKCHELVWRHHDYCPACGGAQPAPPPPKPERF